MRLAKWWKESKTKNKLSTAVNKLLPQKLCSWSIILKMSRLSFSTCFRAPKENLHLFLRTNKKLC